jgi:hypothetical protein
MIRRACILTVLTLGAAVSGADWYCSPSGSDTNHGTQASPFRQIRAAVAVAQPGDTILVADGSYLGFSILNFTGTAAAPLTIQAQGTGAIVTNTTDRTDYDSNRDIIFISFCSYVVINGLQGYSATRAGLRVDTSPNITVEHCTFGNNAVWGIVTDFSNNLLIQYNDCYGSVQQHGVYVSDSSLNPVVRYNTFHDNAACGLHMNGGLADGPPGYISNPLIEFNLIYNNGSAGGSGINCDGVTNGVFIGNVVYNEHASGMSLYCDDGSPPSTNAVIIGNTFDLASDGRWPLNIDNASTGAIVYDNILLNHNASHGSIMFDAADSMVGFTSGYNVLCSGGIDITEDDGASTIGFSAWQAAGHDAHSITATQAALFTDWSTGEYSLIQGAPAIGAGIAAFAATTAPNIDLVGNPRPGPTGYSIGAYEVPGGATTTGSGTSASGSTTGATGGTSSGTTSGTSAGTTGGTSAGTTGGTSSGTTSGTSAGTTSGTSSGTASATNATTTGSGTSGVIAPSGGGGGGGCGLGAGLGALGTILLTAVAGRRHRRV